MLTISQGASPFSIAAAAAALSIAAASSGPFQAQGSGSVASVSATPTSASVEGGSSGASVAAPGAASLAMTLQTVDVAPAAGAVEIDLSQGNTFVVALNQAATLSFANWPASGRSQRVAVYFVQDATGGRVVTWPAVKWPDGAAPTLSAAPNATDCVVFDSPDGGASVFGNLVGEGYA